jgi:hypothetical protein
MHDKDYNKSAGHTYAATLRETFSSMKQVTPIVVIPNVNSKDDASHTHEGEAEPVDVMANIEQQAIEALRVDGKLITKIESSEGAAWGTIKAFFLTHLPTQLDDRERLAFQLVKKAMDHLYDQSWESYKNPQRNNATYIRRKG